MQDAPRISIFTPSNTPPHILELIMVQRQQLLQDAVERVKESALTGNKHHQLFVGPRGCGKTYLATLIVHRITQNIALHEHLRIAWLNEDETSTSLLELLIRIHSALMKRHPNDYTGEQIAPAYELKPAEALDFVKARLLESLGKHTLMVVVENLDLIFEGLADSGQKQLRAFIQENPRLCIVATAQRLTEGLSNRDNPFFGFFQTEHLKTLTVHEAAQLLQNIASLDKGKTDVVKFLSTSRGLARVRALHHLSGGNHRIYIVLSQFITGDNVETLVALFMEMVDDLTPYYQERLRSLPPLQRRIIEYLCTCERTVPVKDIAKRLFTTPPTISSQLQELREKGYADSSQRGRESLYEISEPLMRICVEVKDNQRLGPLRLLVDFLRVWYEDKDLEQRLGLETCSPLGRDYLKAAIERNQREGNLRKKWLLHDLPNELPKSLTKDRRSYLLQVSELAPEAAVLAFHLFSENPEEAVRNLDEAIIQEARSSDKAGLLLCRSALHWVLGNATQETEDLKAVIDLPEVAINVMATALLSLSINYQEAGDTQKEIDCYTQVIGLVGVPAEEISKALFNRGFAFGELGDTQREIEDYTQIISLPGASVKQVAEAFFNRGFVFDQSGDTQRAIDDYTQIVDLKGAPLEQMLKALFNRGVSFGKLGDKRQEIAHYTQIIDLPGVSQEQMAMALFNRGIAFQQLGDTQSAIENYTQVISLTGAPAEQVAKALVNRGVFFGKLGDTQREVDDYNKVIGLTGAPVEQIAKALINRGLSFKKRGDSQREIDDYTQVISLHGVPLKDLAKAFYNRALCFRQTQQTLEARQDFERVLNTHEMPLANRVDSSTELAKIHWSEGRWGEGMTVLEQGLKLHTKANPSHAAGAEDLIQILYEAGLPPQTRTDRTRDLFVLYKKYEALSELGGDVVSHMGAIYEAGTPFPSADNLEQWYTAWESAGAGEDEFKLPLRLLRTGIDFIKTGGKDMGVLLDLTSPERTLMKQALGLAEPED